jgi:Flp pilus assembly protein TadD
LTFDPATMYRDQAIRCSQQGRFAESEAHSREALRFRPDDVDVLNELGVAVWRQGRSAEAEAIYRRARELRPGDFRLLTNMGLAVYSQGRIDEAGDLYRAAIEAQPNNFDAIMNLGIVLTDQGRFEEGMDLLRIALALRPDSADALQNVGMNLARRGSLKQAIGFYEQALRQQPDSPEAHLNYACALLASGDYERGWPEYEWRFKCHTYSGRQINRTFWNGDDLGGRTILLHWEQGYGDTLQFIRYAPMVKGRGGRVLVLCQTPLLRLVARCSGVDLAFDGSCYEPDCHVHAPLMSLPSIFGTTLDTLPARVPYLANDAVLVEYWRSELARAAGFPREASQFGRAPRPFLLGIVWQGNPAHRADRRRSFPLAQFAELTNLPRVRLISLQTEHGLDQLKAVGDQIPVIDLPGRRGRDFSETAAIMAHLDLVITPDTAVAHLAGGLGLPVWVPLSSVGEWRWLHGRDESAWYPTMRLFRQTKFGDWDGVFRRMTDALDQELAEKAVVA